jgi:PAS domain S-box-containing protein
MDGEQNIKDSELRYRRLFEAAQDGILILDAQTGMIDDVNPYLIKMLGYSHAELINKKLWEIGLFRDVEASQETFKTLQKKKYIRYEDLPLKTKDGQLIQVEFVSNVYQVGKKKVIQCNIRNITEHKRIIAALQKNEKTYYDLINQSPDGFFVIDTSGNLLTVNNAICLALQYTKEELLSLNIWDLIPEQYFDQYQIRIKNILKGKSLAEEVEYKVHGKDGKEHYVEIISAPHYSGNDIVGFQGIAHDITDRKLAEVTLRENEYILSQSQRIAHIGSWSWDMLGPIEWTQEMYSIYGLSGENFTPTIESLITLVHPEDRAAMQHWLEACGEGKSPDNLVFRTILPDGSLRFLIGSGDLLYGEENKPILMAGTVQDITDLKVTEQKLAYLAKFPSENPNPVLRLNGSGIILYANPASDPLLSKWGSEVGGSVPRIWCDLAAQVLMSHKNKTVEVEAEEKIYLVTVTPEIKSDYVTIYGHDITDRKQSEASLLESESKFRSYVENAPLGLFIADQTGHYIEANKMAHEMLGYTMSELMQLSIPNVVAPQSLEAGLQVFQKVIQDGFAIGEYLFCRKDGSQFWSTVLAVKLSEDRYMSYCQDITERKLAEERIRKQLAHLTAMSTIDRTIASSFDLNFTLLEILQKLKIELGIDAADILIYESSSQMLEFGVEIGFRTDAVRKAKVRLGENYAGKVALERHLIQIPDLNNEPDQMLLTTLLRGEDFVCYYGVPLIAKGQVKGVLEVFNRTPLEPDTEWMEFLNTLAGQAAIAIENSSLLETLRRSNMELSLAYDDTIEGWSHALDLRDKETEGHTKRVTEITVNLAHTFGMSESEIVDVRRGALLHDIGKMGVPDNILLKPGPLTEEEWVKMKAHPTFAFQLLSPIRYLQRALDIPYCHHEKWDGSGYPRGLKGTQIPLTARIFAVVDVWDALTSDRPYRPSWLKEKAREHILSSSGSHFDPQVVEAFIKMMCEEV